MHDEVDSDGSRRAIDAAHGVGAAHRDLIDGQRRAELLKIEGEVELADASPEVQLQVGVGRFDVEVVQVSPRQVNADKRAAEALGAFDGEADVRSALAWLLGDVVSHCAELLDRGWG